MQGFKKIAFALAATLAFQSPVQAKVISTVGDVEAVGKLSQISGKISLITPKGGKKNVKSQAPVFPGQIIRTESNGYAELVLSDGTRINLGPKTGIQVEQFVYDPNMDYGRMNLRILSGVYRFTSGRMRGKKNHHVRITLPAGKVNVKNATILGQVFEKRSVVILWKSLLKVESFEPLSVKTKEDDPYFETVIEKQGFGCIIENENYSPSPPLKIPEMDIIWLESKLFPAPVIEEKKEEKPVEFSIQAIVYDQEDSTQTRLVVVGGKLYKEGDIVDDHKILTIEPATVSAKNMTTDETKVLKVAVEPKKGKRTKTVEEKPVVESLFYDEKNPKNSFAYIGGTLYREGASVLGFKLLSILKDRIKMKHERNGKETFFKLQSAASGAQQGEVPLVLQSISFNAENPEKSLAALNGVLYHEGESWENFEVTKISRKSVLLTDKKTGKSRKVALEKTADLIDEKPHLEVQIILFDQAQKEKSQVAIQGTLYKLGDLVDGYEILDIEKNSIRVRKKGDVNWKTYVINHLPAIREITKSGS